MRSGPFAVAAAAVALALASGCSDDGVERDDAGRLTEAGDVSVFDLRVGDCVDPGTDVEAELEQVRGVPCEEPHTTEVFALVEYDAGDVFPGDDALADFADAKCVDRFEGYVETAYLDSTLFFTYLLPSLTSWDEGKDREVVCLVVTNGEPLTRSVEGSGL